MTFVTPTMRISLGLTSIIISVLLTGSLIGLIPDKSIINLESRKTIAQSVTTQCTFAARYNNVVVINRIMNDLVELNPNILSLGMRGEDGEYIAQTKDHQTYWVVPQGEESTLNHWKVPINQGDKLWATMEISFPPEASNFLFGYKVSPLTLMVIFCACGSFLMFTIYMKRVLRDLDPSKVMPSRVAYALNVLIEGVILVDMNDRIVLANSAFAKKVGSTVDALMGSKASELPWIDPETSEAPTEYPWIKAKSNGTQSGIRLNLGTETDSEIDSVRNFMVSSVPILNDNNDIRGIMATFDDVTELEQKNIQLSEMLVVLGKSRDKVEQQNKELEILATRDSLTGCLNRRAFFAKGEQFLATAIQNGGKIACVMTDIDFFKKVNDNYGHHVGDQVIKFFADSLMSSVRGEDDVVGRYGGEEFCIVLQNVDVEKAAEITERIRIFVMEKSPVSIEDAPGIKVTASFGISSTIHGSDDLEELINQADQALYKAKETGRNRVVCWEKEFADELES